MDNHDIVETRKTNDWGSNYLLERGYRFLGVFQETINVTLKDGSTRFMEKPSFVLGRPRGVEHVNLPRRDFNNDQSSVPQAS